MNNEFNIDVEFENAFDTNVLVKAIVTDDYNVLKNKPSINNVPLNGNLSLDDLNIQEKTNIPTKVSDLVNDEEFKTPTEIQSMIDNSINPLSQTYVTKTELSNKDYNSITSTDMSNWNNKSDFSGSYTDLTNKPNIPTKVSDLTNDSGYISQIKTINNQSLIGTGNIDIQGGGSSDYSDLENKPSINNVTLNGNKSLNDLGIQPAGDYALNSTIPTKTSDLTNDSGFITGYTETDPVFSASASAGITSQDITNWNNKSTFSGDYNDLTNKPTIPTVPSNVSAFTNDAGYLTTHQDITGKLDTSKVKSSTSTTSGDVYDVTYINSVLGDIESLLGGI